MAASLIALLAIAFVPLVLGQELARKKLRVAMIVWPLAGIAGGAAAVSNGASEPPRVAVVVSIAASLVAYVAFRASSLPGAPGAPPPSPRRPLATLDRSTFEEFSGALHDERAAIAVATPPWLLVAQVGLVGLGLTVWAFGAAAADAYPVLAAPGNTTAAFVAAIAYVRW